MKVVLGKGCRIKDRTRNKNWTLVHGMRVYIMGMDKAHLRLHVYIFHQKFHRNLLKLEE